MKFEDITPTPDLYVLVGLPGSGKSSWTKKFLATVDKPFVVVSTDDILERIASENDSRYNDVINQHYGDAEKEMKRNATEAFRNGISIIWDQTNMGANKRRKILAQTPKQYRKIAVVFELDDQELFKRLNKREEETGKKIGPKIIETMKAGYSEPSKSEGFDEIVKIKG